ncbi:MAG TPA: nuclear transport factor 2 family protein, partial [Candidatus Limnocylindrales bacterium]|nr:nuclear transport factor 2 family protein [Candidatus Limnocylindrales bacterium]
TALPALHAQAGNAASTQVAALVQRFIKAQQSFDPATLKETTTDDYLEVSPQGEVDKREAVLGFYDPAHRVEVPATSISDENIRTFNDTAVEVVAITYKVGAAGNTHDVRIRATFVALRQQGAWKLASAQYTGIKPPAPKQ